MIATKRLLLPSLMALLLTGSVLAQEGEPEGPPPAPPPPPKADAPQPPALKAEDREKLKEIMRKMKAGEELTADERSLVEKMRPRAAAKDRPGAPGAAGAEGRKGATIIEGQELVNAIDSVSLALAQAHLAKGEADKAIEVLVKLAKATDDKTAAGYAHLALARLYRQKGDKEKADEELKLVGGPAMAGALAMMLEGGGKDADGAAKLEEMLKSAKDPLAKALIIRRLSALYARTGDSEKLAALAERAAKILSYKEALAAQEQEDKIIQRANARGNRPGEMGPGAGAGGPPWMRPGQGPGAEGGKGGAAGQNEALKAQIKELEAAGLVDEAEALKKQLRTLEERRGDQRPAAKKDKPAAKGQPGGDENLF
jgi:tetratricopeptide (TPR) repeat protein